MSKRSFLRRFAEATGKSPGEWVTAARIDEAKRLLETTDMPVEAWRGSPASAASRHCATISVVPPA